MILLYTSHSWVNCKFPSSFCINYLCTSFYGCAKCRDSPSPTLPVTRLRVATDRNSSCSGTKEVKGGHTIFDEFCTHIWNMLVHFYGKRKRQQLLSRIDGWLPRARRVNRPSPLPLPLHLLLPHFSPLRCLHRCAAVFKCKIVELQHKLCTNEANIEKEKKKQKENIAGRWKEKEQRESGRERERRKKKTLPFSGLSARRESPFSDAESEALESFAAAWPGQASIKCCCCCCC